MMEFLTSWFLVAMALVLVPILGAMLLARPSPVTPEADAAERRRRRRLTHETPISQLFKGPKPMAHTYHINLDERGEFFADVRDENDTTVFEIHGFDIFEDGFMADAHDIDGLTAYLQHLNIIQSSDTLEIAK
jgi:hypothetical protein